VFITTVAEPVSAGLIVMSELCCSAPKAVRSLGDIWSFLDRGGVGDIISVSECFFTAWRVPVTYIVEAVAVSVLHCF
jgi:hypothetical protein